MALERFLGKVKDWQRSTCQWTLNGVFHILTSIFGAKLIVACNAHRYSTTAGAGTWSMRVSLNQKLTLLRFVYLAILRQGYRKEEIANACFVGTEYMIGAR
jgi:hypothetical protein